MDQNNRESLGNSGMKSRPTISHLRGTAKRKWTQQNPLPFTHGLPYNAHPQRCNHAQPDVSSNDFTAPRGPFNGQRGSLPQTIQPLLGVRNSNDYIACRQTEPFRARLTATRGRHYEPLPGPSREVCTGEQSQQFGRGRARRVFASDIAAKHRRFHRTQYTEKEAALRPFRPRSPKKPLPDQRELPGQLKAEEIEHPIRVHSEAKASSIGLELQNSDTDASVKSEYNNQHQDAEDRIKLAEFNANKVNSTFCCESVRFFSEVCLNENDEGIRLVKDDVHNIFKNILEDLKVRIFGSMHTGLATKCSDMDIFLESSSNPGREFIGRNCYLMRRSPKFKDIIVIGQAKVPIIRGTHKKTGIQVDINASSQKSLVTSAVIKFLMSGDSFVKRFTMLINYWAKLSRLVGPNKFTSYLFCLLTVFYLQQVEPPVLPAVSQLFQSDDWGKKHPYEVSLDSDLLKTSNVAEIHSLFRGFFDFYSNFDYPNYVISCYFGKPILVGDIQIQTTENGPEMCSPNEDVNGDNRFQPGEMNVQDLCELHTNKTQSLKPRVFLAFKMSVARVAETLAQLPDPSDWLSVIFSQVPIEVKKDTKKKKKKVVPKSLELTYNFIADDDWFLTFLKDLEFTLKLILVSCSTIFSDLTSLKMKITSVYSVFGKKFKRIVPSLVDGKITVEEFSSKVQTTVERISKPDTRLEAELTVHVVGKGRLLVAFTDLCEIPCVSMFSSYVPCLEITLPKLLDVCHLKWKSVPQLVDHL